MHSATLATVDHETWTRFERTLDQALKDRFALGVRLAERRRHYRATQTGPMEVSIDTDDPFAAVLTIHAPDRTGLLYDIGRAIDASGLDTRSVAAVTRDGIAHDVFRLTDAAGDVPREAGLLGQLKMRLRELR